MGARGDWQGRGARIPGRGTLLGLLLLLCACQAPPPAPVVDRPQPPSQKITHHIVTSNETLYSIAWRYELDYKRLAAANGIDPPYTLRPGQRLTLDLEQAPERAESRKQAPAPAVSRPESKKPSPPEQASPSEKPSPPELKAPSRAPLPRGEWQWQWPVTGRVVREYDADRVLKGISIHASPGAAVTAAAPGVVVYAGSGLRGYGRLVILKHSETHLSAYAQNRTLLVEENQSVAQGEAIAEVGGDPASRDRLYFEIRENGKPVDPLKLLPEK